MSTSPNLISTKLMVCTNNMTVYRVEYMCLNPFLVKIVIAKPTEYTGTCFVKVFNGIIYVPLFSIIGLLPWHQKSNMSQVISPLNWVQYLTVKHSINIFVKSAFHWKKWILFSPIFGKLGYLFLNSRSGTGTNKYDVYLGFY